MWCELSWFLQKLEKWVGALWRQTLLDGLIHLKGLGFYSHCCGLTEEDFDAGDELEEIHIFFEDHSYGRCRRMAAGWKLEGRQEWKQGDQLPMGKMMTKERKGTCSRSSSRKLATLNGPTSLLALAGERTPSKPFSIRGK